MQGGETFIDDVGPGLLNEFLDLFSVYESIPEDIIDVARDDGHPHREAIPEPSVIIPVFVNTLLDIALETLGIVGDYNLMTEFG
jgi:hypothetical protein